MSFDSGLMLREVGLLPSTMRVAHAVHPPTQPKGKKSIPTSDTEAKPKPLSLQMKEQMLALRRMDQGLPPEGSLSPLLLQRYLERRNTSAAKLKEDLAVLRNINRRERLSRVLFREEGQVFARPVSFAALRQQKRHLQNLHQVQQQKKNLEKKTQEDQETLLKGVLRKNSNKEDRVSVGTEGDVYFSVGGQSDIPSVSVSTLSPTSSRSVSSSSPSGTSTSCSQSPGASSPSYQTSNSFSSVSPISPLPSSPQPSQYTPSPRFLSPSPAFTFPVVQPQSQVQPPSSPCVQPHSEVHPPSVPMVEPQSEVQPVSGDMAQPQAEVQPPSGSVVQPQSEVQPLSKDRVKSAGISDPSSMKTPPSQVQDSRSEGRSPVVPEGTLPMGGNSSTSLTLTSPLTLTPRLSTSLPSSPNDPYNSLPSFIYKYHFPEPAKPPKHLRIQEPPPEDGARKRVLEKILSLRPAVVQQPVAPLPSTFTPSDFIKDCLAAHNLYRKRHGAAPLSMDAELCRLSQSWANQMSHTGVVQYRANRAVGENVFCRTERRARGRLLPVITGDQVAAAWYSNIRSYKFNKMDGSLAACAGSFSQMVWCDSKRFGVGMAVNAISGKTIVVAYYTPPGNLSGGFQSNVRPLNTRALAAEILDRQKQEMEQRKKEEQEQLVQQKKEPKRNKFFPIGPKKQSCQEDKCKREEDQAGGDLDKETKEEEEQEDAETTVPHLTSRGSFPPFVDLRQPDPLIDVTAADDVYNTCGDVKVRGVLGAQRRNISGKNATKIFAAHLLGHASSVVVPPGQDPQVVIYIRKKGRWLAGSGAPGGLSSPGSSGGGGIAEGLGGAAMLTTLHATAPAKARLPTEQEKIEAEERKEVEKQKKEQIRRVLEGDTVKSLVKHSISFNEGDVLGNSGAGAGGEPGARRFHRPVVVRRRNTINSGSYGLGMAASSGVGMDGHQVGGTRRYWRDRGSVGRDGVMYSNEFSDIRFNENDHGSSIAEMWRKEIGGRAGAVPRTISPLVEGDESLEESLEESNDASDTEEEDPGRDSDEEGGRTMERGDPGRDTDEEVERTMEKVNAGRDSDEEIGRTMERGDPGRDQEVGDLRNQERREVERRTGRGEGRGWMANYQEAVGHNDEDAGRRVDRGNSSDDDDQDGSEYSNENRKSSYV